MKLRAHRKQISEIMSLSGTKRTTLEDTQTEIVTFTRVLWVLQLLATSSRQINYEKGLTLPLEKQTTLCAEVTDQEIINSLGCIDKVGPVIHNDVC